MMGRIMTRILCLAGLLLAVAAAPARAALEIDITRGNVDPLPIAVSDFYGASSDNAASGRDISGVVTANLARSGLFRPLDPR